MADEHYFPPVPVVRNLIVCEEVVVHPGNPKTFTLVKVLDRIRSLNEPAYPYRHKKLSAFAQLTECRRAGQARFEIVEADTNKAIFTMPNRKLALPNDPLAVHAVRIQIRNCEFPAPGLYWLNFLYDNRLLREQPFVLC